MEGYDEQCVQSIKGYVNVASNAENFNIGILRIFMDKLKYS